MAKPVLLSVDDDIGVAKAVERDLRRRYGKDFRVLSADSGAGALELLGQLKLRDQAVALMLVDQRMPRMNGVQFMEQAIELFPDSKKVLLTAYADTEAAIGAINTARVDHYLMKPWDPPEEQLYPVIDDLLGDWRENFRPPFEGVRVVGHRFSRESHAVRDFLTRNQVPYRWLDIEDEEARRLFKVAGVDGSRLPLVVLPGGELLEAPTNLEIAEKVGITTQAELPFYDIIIIGGGPAGLAAAVYGASEGLDTVLVDREAPGGQAGQSSRIENYLGFPVGLSGSDLSRRAAAQARRFGAELLTVQEVERIEVRGPSRVVRLKDGTELSSHAIIISTGVNYRRLDAPGVDELSGRGVYYGAARTEALSCTDQHVYLIGGANSAGQAALYFAGYAGTVTMLVRGADLQASMSQYLIDQIERTENIRVRPYSSVVGVQGTEQLDGLAIRDSRSGEEETVPASTLFIFIGAAPQTDWLGDAVLRDARGFVLCGPDLLADGRPPPGWDLEREPFFLETSLPGVFVAGDVRHESVKRVASAVGEGAMAVQFVHQYLAGQ